MGAARIALGAVASLLVFPSHSALWATEDRILVPGGTSAVARLLGNVRTEPEQFSASLNRVLLETVRNDHAWEDVPARVDLFALLQTVSELESTFEFPLVLDGTSAAAAGEFDVFSRALGFSLRSRDPPLQLDASEGEFADRRRRVARALGWNLTQIAHRLNEGESVTIEIPVDEVEPILPLRTWQRLTTRHIRRDNALAEMTMDQPLGLLAAGLRRQTRETRAALQDDQIWIYHNASIAFFRYSATIEIRAGAIVLPGGAETAAAWSALLGVPTDRLREFLRALLTRENASYAHIWGALYHLPRPVARYWVDQYVAPPNDTDRLARLLSRLKDAHGNHFFRRARGRAGGLPFLARTTPFEGHPVHPNFHGIPAVWLQSAKDAGDHLSRESLARSASRAGRVEIGPDEALDAIMTGVTSMDGFPALLSHRYAGIARVFETSPNLLTPEVVMALGRAQTRYPATVDVIDRMRLTRPETVRDYFLAVGGLDELEFGAGRERLLSHFQGGVGLVAALYAADHVPDEILEDALAAWVRLHLEGTDAEQVIASQPEWLRTLLERLPPSDPFSPGRGPLEKTLLLALAPAEDPQYLRRDGLLYRGTRARDLAAGMLDRLERERIPSVDQMLGLHGLLGDLSAACGSAEAERSRELASETLALLREASAGRAGPRPGEGRDDGGARLIELLESIANETVAGQFRIYVQGLESARLAVARRMRPILIAPTYFEALSRIDNVLVSELPLIRRHAVLQHRVVDSIGAPDPMAPWKPAKVVRASETDFGAHASGHLQGVPSALLGLHVQTRHPGASELLGLLTRQQTWYLDATRSPWHRVTPEVSKLVEAALAAGDELIAGATVELPARRGPRFAWVSARMPLYRLERHAAGEPVVIGPSERFAVGLAAMRGDAHGPPAPELLSEETRAALLGAVEAVADLPRSLAAVGAPTRHIDGKRRSWVGTWPPYEALDREAVVDALAEREVLDLRLKIIEYLASNDLPGETGADLEIYVLGRVSRELRLESEQDWKSVVAWINRIDDDYLAQGIRWCMERGFYRVQDF
jgi:hypothetical protein